MNINVIKSVRYKTRSVRRAIKNIIKLPFRITLNIIFILKRRHLKNIPKILYAITPPPRLKNIGDHAQAVAINRWLKRHYPGLPVLEMDKDRSRYYLPALRWLINPEDRIFLHSGGNLGDRGLWSENIRRLIIKTFTKNRIVSLPQTIYFSDTPRGKNECSISQRIYNSHPDLTIIGRDKESEKLARELFPDALTFSMPDFVLSLPFYPSAEKNEPPGVLLCLRKDDESILSPENLESLTSELPYQCSYFDTTLDTPIKVRQRETTLKKILDYFYSFDIIITDRYHGLIFAIICRKPCLVLRTVDHKLTSALDWFADVPFVFYVEDIKSIPARVSEALSIKSFNVPDFNEKYFDRLPEKIK